MATGFFKRVKNQVRQAPPAALQKAAPRPLFTTEAYRQTVSVPVPEEVMLPGVRVGETSLHWGVGAGGHIEQTPVMYNGRQMMATQAVIFGVSQ